MTGLIVTPLALTAAGAALASRPGRQLIRQIRRDLRLVAITVLGWWVETPTRQKPDYARIRQLERDLGVTAAEPAPDPEAGWTEQEKLDAEVQRAKDHYLEEIGDAMMTPLEDDTEETIWLRAL